MYVLYESLYGDLLEECDSTNIIGIYKDKEKAIEKANELIGIEVFNATYIIDKERNNINEGLVRFFFDHQENWNCYYELIIEYKEVM